MRGTGNRLIQYIRRNLNSANWYNLRKLKPVSEVFGLERGMPIDRYYIEKFLNENKECIKGNVLEIAESTYSKKFGKNVESFEVLHFTNENPNATIIGDLTKMDSLPHGEIDCFICTQTFQFIYNFKDAIYGAHHVLRDGGILLATVAGISQISRYDMDRWGDYWRFTSLSALKCFEEVFGRGHVKVECHGNVLSAIAFLEGISTEELLPEEMNFKDDNFQVLLGIVARK